MIPAYFLIIAASVVVGILWFLRRAASAGLARLTAIDLCFVLLISGFLGARLLHVFYEDWTYYAASPLAALQVWNGGFVYYGGFLCALFAGAWFCSLRREPFWLWADTAALPLGLTYALGRLACFVNGCCYGYPAAVPWAVRFGEEGIFRHPTQLYASVWEFTLIGLLWSLERLGRQRKFMFNINFKRVPGTLFNLWLMGHSTGRLVMEHFRDDPRGHLFFGSVSIGTVVSLALLAGAGQALWSGAKGRR